MTVMEPPVAAFGLNDPIGALTHLVGALVFLLLSVRLINTARCDRTGIIALSVFAGSAVTLLLASGLFHAMPADTPARDIFQRIDHAAIFILIAGTFTPIHIILFRGLMRWGVLVPIWLAAFLGITLKMLFFESTPEWLGVTAYLVMGWAGLISMVGAYRARGARFVSPLVVGGLAYSVGALCEITSEPTLIEGWVRSHEVFHIAVLVGLGCMWGFITRVARLPKGANAPGSEIEPKPGEKAAEKSATLGNSPEPTEVAYTDTSGR